MTKLKIRVLGDRHQVGIDCSKDTPITKQSFRDECDINKLMAQYQKTGVMTHLTRGLPSYGDFTNAADYHTASTKVLEAQRAFDELPAEVRTRMRNDPMKLLEFLEDEKNHEEGVQLGLFLAPAATADPPTETGPPKTKSGSEEAGGNAPPKTTTEGA